MTFAQTTTRLASAFAAGALALGLASTAQAAFPDLYLSSGDFNAQGTIAKTVDFDAYPAFTQFIPGFTSDPLTLHGSTPYGLTVVGGPPYNPVRNLVTDSTSTQQVYGDISVGGFNMLGFQLANLSGYGEQVFLTLNTNLDTYSYGLYPGAAPENLSFYGFITPVGEYFTGFEMNTTDVDGSFQVTPKDQILDLTDIRLGYTQAPCATRVCGGGAVPEPSAWALTIVGFGLTGAVLRRRRAVAA